ncbi:MAG TPA: 5-oxoprolinase subunit PxpA [Bacteroidales bacterium]|nr:5-oxoprolinase subunit PxpA [Bacteroidales bacterium]
MVTDINCDLGEGSGQKGAAGDDSIMPFITSASIACGFHAGDPLTIERSVRSAVRHGIGIGAHPGYPDREGFGRRPMTISHEELRALILYQSAAVKGIAESAGATMQHVKPHGALYNAAAADYEMAMVIARAVKDLDSSLILVGLSGSQLIRAAREIGLPWASEVFADRAYNDDGTLVSRTIEGAVLHDTAMVIDRAVRMIKEKTVESISGKIIAIEADTICIHGDNEMALVFAENLSETLEKNGIELKYFGKR